MKRCGVMAGGDEQGRKAVKIRLKSVRDLVRLAASSIALGQPTYILRYEVNGKIVYGVMAVFRDFYKLYGIPLLYYVEGADEVPEDANYALLRSNDVEERIEFSKGAKAGYVIIPIINVTEPPEFLL